LEYVSKPRAFGYFIIGILMILGSIYVFFNQFDDVVYYYHAFFGFFFGILMSISSLKYYRGTVNDKAEDYMFGFGLIIVGLWMYTNGQFYEVVEPLWARGTWIYYVSGTIALVSGIAFLIFKK
jgi:hypothetical protein